MRHAHDRRSAGRQLWAEPIWDFTGELRRPTRRPDRYGTRDAANPPERDRDEREGVEWDEQ